MIDDVFVIDAVSHGYHTAAEIAVPPPVGPSFNTDKWMGHAFTMFDLTQPKGAVLDYERFTHGADVDLIARALFAESWTDATVYHDVPLDRLFGENGSSPIWCGEELRDRYPGRVALYGGVSPWRPNALERIDMLIEEYQIKGLKLYPTDIVDGRVVGVDMSDPELCYPLFEHARKRGIDIIAMHKAIPIGPMPIKPFSMFDVDVAALDFPDLTFEIVHGGMAFLEETTMQLACCENVVINLEGTTLLLAYAPRRFAEAISSFLTAPGGEDRIMWATGCMAAHPQPMLEAFWNLETPDDFGALGLPEITPDVKRKILGENTARIVGLDIEQMKREMAGDEFSQLTELAPMWSADADGWDFDAYRAHAKDAYARMPAPFNRAETPSVRA